jgi:FtsZ-binding cell division protein ZapB
VKDSDIIAAIAPDAVSLMDKAIAEIKRLRQENATLTAERDEARRDAERWQADALRLLQERNATQAP